MHLQALGLTEYEARAYAALLTLGRAAPARLARQAGIPRPKVYETLERLEGRGLAARVGQQPLEYVPLSSREYLSRARRSFDDRLGALERELSRLTPDPAPEAVYHLRGEAAIWAMCEHLALNTRRQLLAAGAGERLERLRPLVPRGTQWRGTAGEIPAAAAAGQQAFLLARDGEAAVIAHFLPDNPAAAHGVHTHNPLIVRLVEALMERQD